MDWNSKADRLIKKYDKHKQGIGSGATLLGSHSSSRGALIPSSSY